MLKLMKYELDALVVVNYSGCLCLCFQVNGRSNVCLTVVSLMKPVSAHSFHLFITFLFHALSQDLCAKYSPAFAFIYLFFWLSVGLTAVSCTVCVLQSMNWSLVAICDRKRIARGRWK